MSIFISFSGTAREQYAVNFLNFFNQNGFEGWYDRHELYLGDDLKSTIIEKGIHDAEYGVLIINKTFLSKDWPCEEARLLYKRFKENNDLILFPILLDITKEDLKNSKISFILEIKYQFLRTGESIEKIGYQILNRIFIDKLKKEKIKTFDKVLACFKRLSMSESTNIYNALCAIENFDSTNYRDKTIFLICLIKIVNNCQYSKLLQNISYKIYNNEKISFDVYKIIESVFLICSTDFLTKE